MAAVRVGGQLVLLEKSGIVEDLPADRFVMTE